jgi:uncharacterized Zn finger protein
LFPSSYDDLRTDCSCPDDSNPCKHIAAVYYLLGEEFDRNPFLIFTLRGRSREELVARLRATPSSAPLAAGPRAAAREAGRRERPPGADTTAAGSAGGPHPTRFWRTPILPADFFGEVAVPSTPDAVLRRLGRFPFWRGHTPITDLLAPRYHAATKRALNVFVESAEESPTT